MGVKIAFVACFVTISFHLVCSELAPFITKCKSDDEKCLKESTEAAIPHFIDGIPSLGVTALDPLHYDHLDASSNNLKLILNDMDLTGIKSCRAEKVQRDLSKSKLFIKAKCTLRLKGQYEMSGQLLILPIEGKGNAFAQLNNVVIDVDVDMGEKTDKEGVKHWNVKGWKHTYELNDKSEIELENLFNGNEALGKAARELLRANANDVVAEIGPPVIQAVITRVVKTINHFFHKVPASELSLD